MNSLTMEQLRVIMRECIGADEEVNLDGAIEDMSFTDLGYDSLAVLELCTRVQDRCGVAIPDDAVDGMSTPRKLLDFVNGAPAKVAD
jgi:acyl carrier protein